MKKPERITEFIDGLSKSAWKSLAVKALRIGWLPGLERAHEALGKGDMRQLLLCGLLEDTFPPVADFAECLAEIRGFDYAALAARDTHHGRGLTPRFCDLEPAACAAAKTQRGPLWAKGREFNVWLPPRSLNCWWTWLEIAPQDSPQPRREIDRTPWTGMPPAMLDSHTFEGKATGGTVLSGSYQQHRRIGELVECGGWDYLRAKVHGEPKAGTPVTPVQTSLL